MRARLLQVGLLAAAVIGAQLVASASGREFFLTPLTMAACYALVALGLSLLMGFAGQISLGHAAFFAIGGYAAAALTAADLAAHRGGALVAALGRAHLLVPRTDPFGGEALGVHPWAALPAAVLFAAGVAWAIGRPVLRLRGHYLAMATLGFGSIVQSAVVGTERLGAADGISGVPPLPLLGGAALTGSAAARVVSYYVAWGQVALAMLLLLNLVQSRTGRALRAIHGAEDAASAMGVDTARLKLRTFVLSAAIAAAAGVTLTHLNGGIGPSEASPMKSVRYVATVAVGGMGSLWGVLAASVLLNVLSLRGVFGTFDDGVFAAVLLLVMLFSPQGVLRADLSGALRRLLHRDAPGEL